MPWETVWNAIEQDPQPTFQKIKPLFLAAMQVYDADWVAGRLDEGIYRQKGERFRRVLTSLIAARTGVTVTARTVAGLTSAHRPDIVVQDRAGGPLLAGEVKMSGTRGHVTPQGVQRPDRGASVDYEKRLKEVKYTSVDLKLRYEGLDISHFFFHQDDTSGQYTELPHPARLCCRRCARGDHQHHPDCTG